MEIIKYHRGSEWRKWDLQIHTPMSFLSNEFDTDFDQYAKLLIENAIEKKIAVIGITDYFTIDGFKLLYNIINNKTKLNELVGAELANKCSDILILPNIELRTSIIVNNSRVNFHVIFSEDISPVDIEEHFLRDLKFTAESGPGDPDERWTLTTQNLSKLGKTLKEHHSEFRGKSDIQVGMMNAVISHEDVTEVLERQASRFSGRYIIVVPVDEDLSKCSWDGQAHLSRKLLIQKSHMFFSGNKNTRDFGVGLKHLSEDEFLEEFKSLKPCIHSSDAHNYVSMFEPDKKKYTWIKADPTFRGLRQTIREPLKRIFIGELPEALERVEKNKTKYIKRIDVRKTNPSFQEKWFDQDISFNHNLVAIIGNKGSGKSALADILGLLGNSNQQASFEFLNAKKFKDLKDNKAANFTATLDWESGHSISKNLSDIIDDAEVETIKYIPQGRLENICNEIEVGDDSEFQRELQSVIFSRIPNEARLGRSTLKELIDYRTEESIQAIKQLYASLEKSNNDVIKLEELSDPNYKKNLNSQLVEKKRELEAHKLLKPTVLKKPEEDESTKKRTEVITQKIEKLAAKWDELEEQITKAKKELNNLTQKIASITKLLSQLDNLEDYVKIFKDDAKSIVGNLGLDINTIVKFSIYRKDIYLLKEKLEQSKDNITSQLDPENKGSLSQSYEKVKIQVANLREQLDKPNKEYQAYKKVEAEWNKRNLEMIGSHEKPESIKGIEAQIKALKDVHSQLSKARNKQIEESLKIFKEKKGLMDIYAELYGPVQDFISDHYLAQDKFSLEFSVAIGEAGFVNRFLTFVNQGRRGSFQGKDEGEELTKKILDSADLQTEKGLKGFLESIIDHLTKDKAKETSKVMLVSDQLRKDYSKEEFYQYVFSLEYLEPKYILLWEGKKLDQLSPGERGTLLLIFYLLIDDSEIPLVIDQPEGNLDNLTVAKVLVDCVREAKVRRQVFLVTHNPNLAVVCDAEQIIYARLEKDKKNELTYISGALEEPIICKEVVSVLEGSRPVFDIREYKYSVGEE